VVFIAAPPVSAAVATAWGTLQLQIALAGAEIKTGAGAITLTNTNPYTVKTIVNNETFVLGPGDVCRHPRDASHRVEALEDTVFVEVKSPPIEFGRVFGSVAAS
jgi:hypothetical protein